MQEKLKSIIHHLNSKKVAYGDIRYVHQTHQSLSIKDQTVEAISENVRQFSEFTATESGEDLKVLKKQKLF